MANGWLKRIGTSVNDVQYNTAAPSSGQRLWVKNGSSTQWITTSNNTSYTAAYRINNNVDGLEYRAISVFRPALTSSNVRWTQYSGSSVPRLSSFGISLTIQSGYYILISANGDNSISAGAIAQFPDSRLTQSPIYQASSSQYRFFWSGGTDAGRNRAFADKVKAITAKIIYNGNTYSIIAGGSLGSYVSGDTDSSEYNYNFYDVHITKNGSLINSQQLINEVGIGKKSVTTNLYLGSSY